MFKGDQFYGGFQEYGWTPGKRMGRKGRKKVKGAGHVPGKYFLKNAFNASANDALAVMQNELLSGLEKACNEILKAQRLAAQNGKNFKRSSYLK